MTIRVAINGLGRIGRNVLRAHYESGKSHDLEIVAINTLGSEEVNAHLLRYDTVHGRFNGEVTADGPDCMVVNGDRIRMFSTRDPREIPWGDYGVDVVLECTGAFTSKEKAQVHLDQGAKKVLISAPGKNADATVVYGVNDNVLTSDMTVVSNASCTTNCLAPFAKVLMDTFGIKRGFMNTIHSYTNDQKILDQAHKDLRRARAANLSMIPTTTGAARAVSLVLPELKGKLDGFATRVPTPDGSMVDLTVELEQEVTIEEVNAAMKAAAEGPLKGILEYVEDPIVSSDIVGDDHSSLFDSKLTMVLGGKGNLVKCVSWYDNEWGYSNRVKDLAKIMMQA